MKTKHNVGRMRYFLHFWQFLSHGIFGCQKLLVQTTKREIPGLCTLWKEKHSINKTLSKKNLTFFSWKIWINNHKIYYISLAKHFPFFLLFSSYLSLYFLTTKLILPQISAFSKLTFFFFSANFFFKREEKNKYIEKTNIFLSIESMALTKLLTATASPNFSAQLVIGGS